MAPDSPELQVRRAFGRAFLIELERGDRDLARLFAKAFLAQANVLTDPGDEGGGRLSPGPRR